VDTGSGVALTTVSHLSLLHKRYTRKGIKELHLKLDRPDTAVEVYVEEFPVSYCLAIEMFVILTRLLGCHSQQNL
jgi:hypothetical protein